MLKRIFEATMTALVIGAVTFLCSFLLTFFFGDKSTITIGESTQINNNQFSIPISIHTNSKQLENFQIEVDDKVTEDQIKASQLLKIKIIENNVGPADSSIIKIGNIPQDENINLLILTNKKLSDNQLKVNSSGNGLTVKYDSEKENPIKGQMKELIFNAILYTFLVGISSYYTNRSRDEKINLFKELLQQQNKKLEKEEKRIKEVEDKIKNSQTDSTKRQILLQAKLNDYRKELNFWRNTIRKILYQLTNGEKKADELIKIVSKALKTYQTNEKNEHDFETLKVLSKMIGDNDEERT